MKIVHIETVINCGTYARSKHWQVTRKALHASVRKCAWPPGSKTFTIHPQSGKKRDEGNGVGPIKMEFVRELRERGWTIEGAAKNHLGQQLGDFDAVLLGPHGPIVAEWETGNISSSHRSMNKLTMLVSDGVIAARNQYGEPTFIAIARRHKVELSGQSLQVEVNRHSSPALWANTKNQG